MSDHVALPSNLTWTGSDVYTPMQPAWKASAECADLPTDLFFPDTGGQSVPDVAAAKTVCERCPVRQECLDYAVDRGERWGIWGGLTYTERRTVRRKRFGNRDTPEIVKGRSTAVRLAAYGADRQAIAEHLGVSATTVDRWLRDART